MAITEAGDTSLGVVLPQSKVTQLTPVTGAAIYILFTHTSTVHIIASGKVIQASNGVTPTWPASRLSKVKVVVFTPITFVPGDSWLTLTATTSITLKILGTCGITFAGSTPPVVGLEVVVVLTPLTVRSVRVVPAVDAMTSPSCCLVEVLIEITTVSLVVTFTAFAFIGTSFCCSSPGLVVVHGETLLTVDPIGIVLTPTLFSPLKGWGGALTKVTLLGMAIALAPGSN